MYAKENITTSAGTNNRGSLVSRQQTDMNGRGAKQIWDNNTHL